MIKYILKKQLDNTIKNEETFNIFSYTKKIIKELCVEHLSVDYVTSNILRPYLFNECLIDTNKLAHTKQIETTLKNIDTLGNLKEVPYITNISYYYFIYKKCIFKNITTRNSSRLELVYIRGTLDINSLIKSAYEYNTRQCIINDNEPYFGNFYITEHFGTSSEGNMFNFNVNSNSEQNNKVNGSARIAMDEDTPTPENSTMYKYDIPLLYDKNRIFDYKEIKVNPFDNYYFPKPIMDYVSNISQWLKNDKWFTERQLPYKRGILLHGPAGTGKSSFAKVLGLKFGIPIHQFHLSNMTDKDFKDAWENAVQNPRVIILIEDFDNVYHKRTPVNSKTKLNFDTILNTISGIQDMSGVILVITTNDITKIDEAIGVSNTNGISTRPGRIDDVIYLGKMENTEKHKLATKILKDWPLLIEDVMANTTDYTAAQVQEYSIKLALNELKKSNTII